MGILRDSLSMISEQGRGDNGYSRRGRGDGLVGGIVTGMLHHGAEQNQKGGQNHSFGPHEQARFSYAHDPAHSRYSEFSSTEPGALPPSYEVRSHHFSGDPEEHHIDRHSRSREASRQVHDSEDYSVPWYEPEDSGDRARTFYANDIVRKPANNALGLGAPEVPPRPVRFASDFQHFTPTYVVCKGDKGLDGGFPTSLPPCLDSHGRHPFETHNVSQQDWQRFLREIQSQGALSFGDQLGAKTANHAANAVMSGGMVVGIVAKKAIRAYKINGVSPIVDAWNQHFFRPRKMEAIFTRGLDRLDSGQCQVPKVDMRCEKGAYSSATQASSTMDRKKRKELEKEQKKAEKNRSADGNDSAYRLFIVPMP